MSLIKHCVEYRTLRGKKEELGVPLATDEAQLLDDLERFFHEQASGPDGVPEFAQREHRRRPVHVAVEFRRPDGAAAEGVVTNLSGGGVYVETVAPLATGQRTVLRIFDAVAGREWRFGAAVAWQRWGAGMGLSFVGIPLEVRLGHRGVRSAPLAHAA